MSETRCGSCGQPVGERHSGGCDRVLYLGDDPAVVTQEQADDVDWKDRD